jgi:transcriptional regulator with XRE-family HTH domain
MAAFGVVRAHVGDRRHLRVRSLLAEATGSASPGLTHVNTYPQRVNYSDVVRQFHSAISTLALVGSAPDDYRVQVMDTNEYPLEHPDELAERIRAYRLTGGVTQRELADQLGVTQQSVARWEQGSPPRKYMLRVIESLLGEAHEGDQPTGLADIIGIRPPAGAALSRPIQDARKTYVQGCLKLLERGERLPNRVLLLLADELGWGEGDS